METATDWPPGYPIYNIVMTLAVLHHAAHVLLGPDETDYDLVVNIRRTADTAAPGGHILGELAAAGIGVIKLQALVYDILPSTTEGVLFISAQVSTDAVNALRKVRVLI